jgi:hypothetical protein
METPRQPMFQTIDSIMGSAVRQYDIRDVYGIPMTSLKLTSNVLASYLGRPNPSVLYMQNLGAAKADRSSEVGVMAGLGLVV